MDRKEERQVTPFARVNQTKKSTLSVKKSTLYFASDYSKEIGTKVKGTSLLNGTGRP